MNEQPAEDRLTIDGVPVVAGDRLLWSARDLWGDEAEEPQNGIYTVSVPEEESPA